DHGSPGAVVGEPVADLALGRCPVGTLLEVLEALLAKESDGSVHVAVRLLERPLGVHDPRAGPLAELADEPGRDLRCHQASSFSPRVGSPSAAAERFVSSAPSLAGSSPVSTGKLSPSAWGSMFSPAETSSTLSSGALSSAGAGASWACCNSCAEIFCLPADTASASACTTSRHERIASSLPGIT